MPNAESVLGLGVVVETVGVRNQPLQALYRLPSPSTPTALEGGPYHFYRERCTPEPSPPPILAPERWNRRVHREVAPRVGENLQVLAPTADYVPTLDLGTEVGCQHLRSLIEETRAALVVLDTLYRFVPGCRPVDNAEMGRVFGRLNELAQRTGADPWRQT